MINPAEMGMPSLDYVVNTIQGISGYRSWFKDVFGHDVNIEDVAKAIACFERTLVSGDSPFDRFVSGDENALDESAKRGLKLFEGKARCDQCHSRPFFTDEKYHNIGIDWDTDNVDLGRYRVTGRADDIGAFKTPTLREIAFTGPYMHDGSLATLEDTIDFYDKGGNSNPFLDIEMRRPTRSLDEVLAFYENRQSTGNEDTPEIELEKLNLTSQERADLVSFLNSLSGRGWQLVKPPDHFPE
jgi:cytochrome c peroxidase